MRLLYIAYAGLAVIILFVIALIVFVKKPRKLKNNYFEMKWQELQHMLGDKTQWPHAITQADQLLDEALKKRRLNGKSMGERLVSAQRLLRDNDGVWFGHKLRKQLDQQPDLKLRRNDVKDALIGLKQALKDLGAFDDK